MSVKLLAGSLTVVRPHCSKCVDGEILIGCETGPVLQ